MRKALVVIGGLIVAGILAVVVVGIWRDKDTNWWAAWGQWVGGAGSILAAAIALGIAQRGWNLAARESREREASLFAIWVVANDEGLPIVRYINATSLPVYDVNIRVKVQEQEFGIALGAISPTEREGRPQTRLTQQLHLMVYSRTEKIVGKEKMYVRDEGGEESLSMGAYTKAYELTSQISLTTTFRQGTHKWTLRDSVLTQN
jgi:hypothetical protein